MNLKETWGALWEDGILHIQGVTDEFPNDFSTSSLKHLGLSDDRNALLYELVFHRDKEPFCDKDLVGPVHYWERNLPGGIQSLVVRGADGDCVVIPVPKGKRM